MPGHARAVEVGELLLCEFASVRREVLALLDAEHQRAELGAFAEQRAGR